MSVTVLTPDKKEFPLDFWSVISPAFSSLGKKAEWRVLNKEGSVIPVGLIVRMNASEVLESSESRRTVSYLAVAKISRDQACVTDKLHSTKGANVLARQAADSSSRKACLKIIEP